MRRLVTFPAVLAVCALAIVAGPAQRLRAQQAPLQPDQIDPAVTRAIGQYVAGNNLHYAGDCQRVTADQVGQICSLSYGQPDQSTYVTLSVVQADGSTGQPYDNVTVLPPPPAFLPVNNPSSEGLPTTDFQGPIGVAAALGTDTCSGGPVGISVTVGDANSNGVIGAQVTGFIQFRSRGVSFGFPDTDSQGHTSTTVNTGAPSGGYDVVWTITAFANGYSATTTVSCYAP
jgi:hypothetical protein